MPPTLTPVPLFQASAGAVSQVSVATMTDTSTIVAAVNNSQNKLEVLAWLWNTQGLVKLGSNTIPSLEGDSESSASVAITSLDAARVVTAHVNTSRNLPNLSINVWAVGPQQSPGAGPYVWWQSANEGYSIGVIGTQPSVCIAALSSAVVVTAIVNTVGNLVVQAWNIGPWSPPAAGLNSLISLAGPAYTGGPVSPESQVAITALNSTQFVTAIKNQNGDLEVIPFSVSGSGESLTLHRPAQTPSTAGTAGNVRQVSIAASNGIFLEGGGAVVTAVLNSTLNLELIAWNVSASGSISRQTLPWPPKGNASQTAVCSIITGRGSQGIPEVYTVTAVRDSSTPSRLAVEVWGQISSKQGSSVSYVALAPLPNDNAGNGYFVTASAVPTATKGGGTSDNLQIQVWSFTP
jgi:hypothetical protein